MLKSFIMLSVFISLNAFAGEFEFFHCIQKTPLDNGLFQHFVIDMREEGIYAIYSAVSGEKVAMDDLVNLELIDESLKDNTIGTNYDIIWTSAKNQLVLKLVIRDNEGLLMSGVVINHQKESPIECVDSTLESAY